MKKAVILLLLAAAIASAQQKQRIAVLPSVGDLEPQGLILLTDKVREIATKNLPIEDFNILKQDVITRMIGEEELYRSCKEGVCIGDLAKKTNANYGARCDVIMFNNRLILKFELYSVNEEAIFETFTDYNVKDFDGMLASLEERLPSAFKKMISVSDRALANSRNRAREQQRQEAKARQEYKPAPQTHTVATAANPPDGGTVSRSPNYTAYYAGTEVTVTASPNAGYTFAGWNDGPVSANNNITITVEDNLTLTANFQRIPPPAVAAAPPKPKTKPHEPPSPQQKTKNRSSAGAGGFFANDFGGGLEWDNGEYISMPYSGGGVYIYYDVVYAEIFAGFSGGGGKWKSADVTDQNSLPDLSRAYMNFGALVKYPLGAENVQFFPLLGIDYEMSVSAKIAYDYYEGEYKFDGENGRPAANALSALWFKLGGGIDIGVSESAYLRVELMYGWRTANAYEKESASVPIVDSSNGRLFTANSRLGNGLTLNIGIGVKF